jgi:uncharacterized protein (TIGR02246 family)
MSLPASQLLTVNQADEAAVRDLYQQMMDAWNKGSGEAFAAPFEEDGDLVAFDGTRFKGRQDSCKCNVAEAERDQIALGIVRLTKTNAISRRIRNLV